MRQVHAGTGLLKSVDCPVPAVSGLQYHLGILPSTRDHPAQALDIIRDPHRLERFTGLGHPHDHTAPAMQIYPDKLTPCVL
ncbi:hypothetical protein GCM10009843_18080 [Nocardioides bigeumensis]|uniref:Uncharacterized protein n=1 Tax=Nocardioides bigeumensis TaxID=433657 RepID=A0ABP5JU21_9ACTN